MEQEEKTEFETVPGPEERREFKGRNLEDVISLAEHVLKTPREEFNYEIVTEKTKLFGIKTKEIVIRAWPKKASEENAAADFLARLMRVFPPELEYRVTRRGDRSTSSSTARTRTCSSATTATLLLALQHVLNKVSPVKVQVDCEFFRKRKEKKLREYGQQVAQQVRQLRQGRGPRLHEPLRAPHHPHRRQPGPGHQRREHRGRIPEAGQGLRDPAVRALDRRFEIGGIAVSSAGGLLVASGFSLSKTQAEACGYTPSPIQ